MNAHVLQLKSPAVTYNAQPALSPASSQVLASNKRQNLRGLSDTCLLLETKNLVQKEREILSDVLLHLAEIQKRKLFSPKFQSLTDYAIRELGYSEDEAARRISAMKLLVELPEIENAITDGSLKLATLNLARTHFRNQEKQNEKSDPSLSRETKIEILNQLQHQTTREATRTLIAQSSQPEKLTHFESVKPISSTLNEIKILADDETLKKITRLKGLLAHKHPQLSNGELVAIALDVAIAALDPSQEPKRKSPKTAAPRFEAPTSRPAVNPSSFDQRSTPKRYVPALINRELWRDAGGKCAMCGSTHALERDHIQPFALGGETSKENLRLLCRNCNQRRGIVIFGRRQ